VNKKLKIPKQNPLKDTTTGLFVNADFQQKLREEKDKKQAADNLKEQKKAAAKEASLKKSEEEIKVKDEILDVMSTKPRVEDWSKSFTVAVLKAVHQYLGGKNSSQ
jgi:hypothetical protein